MPTIALTHTHNNRSHQLHVEDDHPWFNGEKHHEEAFAGRSCFVATCFVFSVFVVTCFVLPFRFVETLALCSQDEDARRKRCDFIMFFFGWS
jgi:hypothetical protein